MGKATIWADPVNTKTKTILVVDDDHEMVDLLTDILSQNSYRVLSAYDGLTAIETSNKEKIDLILLDIRMPFFSGFWFCDAFKKRPQTKDVPVVVVSALGADGDVKKAYHLGAVAYIKKPFEAEELLKAIRRALI